MSTTFHRAPGHPHPGASTALTANVTYRLGKLQSMGLLTGVWLDCGCADGGYTEALVEWGVEKAIGIDPDASRIQEALSRRRSDATHYYRCSVNFPFPDGYFDGVLLNEVLEHVADEAAVLREIRRVMRPSGRLVVMSPNRWFPFEGHGMRFLGRNFGFPIPFLPWIPSAWSMPLMAARNYWPGELCQIVADAGFKIVFVGYILPVLELYRWLPDWMIRAYRRLIPVIEHTPLRKFGVSTLVVATPED